MKKMVLLSLLGVAVALLLYVAFAQQAVGWGPRPVPKVRPRPKAEPKEEIPLPPAPDSVDWKETEGLKLSEEEFAQADVFGRFTEMADIAETKPIMIYFYWPEEDAESTDEDIANQVRRCGIMNEILAAEAVRRASTLFHCFKCNAKELGEQFKSEYKIKIVPKVLFFDTKGRKAWQLTSTKAKPDGVARKMASIAAKCVAGKKGNGGGGGACPPGAGGGGGGW